MPSISLRFLLGLLFPSLIIVSFFHAFSFSMYALAVTHGLSFFEYLARRFCEPGWGVARIGKRPHESLALLTLQYSTIC